jgi:hypothetical protein
VHFRAEPTERSLVKTSQSDEPRQPGRVPTFVENPHCPARAEAGDRDRGRLRRSQRREDAGRPRRGPRHDHRSAEPSPVPAAALSGRHGRAVARRHRRAHPIDLPILEERGGAPGPRDHDQRHGEVDRHGGPLAAPTAWKREGSGLPRERCSGRPVCRGRAWPGALAWNSIAPAGSPCCPTCRFQAPRTSSPRETSCISSCPAGRFCRASSPPRFKPAVRPRETSWRPCAAAPDGLPLPRQGSNGDDWEAQGDRPDGHAEPDRIRRLARVALRPPPLSHRVQESGVRSSPSGRGVTCSRSGVPVSSPSASGGSMRECRNASSDGTSEDVVVMVRRG